MSSTSWETHGRSTLHLRPGVQKQGTRPEPGLLFSVNFNVQFWLRARKPTKSLFKNADWCPGEDSNLHDLRHWYLKPARLPIPPPGPARGPIDGPPRPVNANIGAGQRKWGCCDAAKPGRPTLCLFPFGRGSVIDRQALRTGVRISSSERDGVRLAQRVVCRRSALPAGWPQWMARAGTGKAAGASGLINRGFACESRKTPGS